MYIRIFGGPIFELSYLAPPPPLAQRQGKLSQPTCVREYGNDAPSVQSFTTCSVQSLPTH